MSMTLEEAIEKVKILCAGADELSSEYEEQGSFIEAGMAVTFKNAFDTILSALRPVSREQVEKLRGEWIPAESDFDDDDTLFDVEDWRDWQCSACHNEVCYDDPMERRWLPKFCPNCGAPMTDEAVEIVMERMEELHGDL